MPLKIAFAGFRHGHIFDLYARAAESEEFTVVAASEEDAETREQLLREGKAQITHNSHRQMLDKTACDVLAVGDYFGRRGEIVIDALERGKHVISDKPICTSLDELQRIESLANEKNLKVGCMLDLRDSGVFIRVRELVRDRAIGDVQAISIGGQHPLMRGTRPGWYFEEGKHGGTINDIGIHAIDLISWITGLRISKIVAARSWNAFVPDVPHFKDAGQFMFELENGCGVLGDVSYFMPDGLGYSLDLCWRVTLFGSGGVIEASINSPQVRLVRSGSQAVELIDPAESVPGGYLRSFLQGVRNEPAEDALTTKDVLDASRIALMTQQAGEQQDNQPREDYSRDQT